MFTPYLAIVNGTTKGNVIAPNMGVMAIKFLSIKIIYSNHSVSALSLVFVSSKGVAL